MVNSTAPQVQEHGNARNDFEPAHNPEKAVRAAQTPKTSRRWILGPVEKKHSDLVLLAHSMASGMVDAACFSNWSVFAAMQTGNTVLLGLSTATLSSNPHAWLTTLVSIASYLVGAFFTFRAATFFTPSGALSNRLLITSLFMLQALLILISAAFVAADLVPHNPPGRVTEAVATTVIGNIKIVSLLPLLAFQAGMQIACSRLLGFNELPVNVLTSTYCDIMGDSKLLSRNNEKRDRRVYAAALLLAGAISSTWLMRSRGGLTAALFVAGGIKFVAAVGAFLFLGEAKQPTDKK